jgi:hypothetical protein
VAPFVAGSIWIAIGIVLLVFRVRIAGFYRERLNQVGRVAKAPARAANTSTMVFLSVFALVCGSGLLIFAFYRLLT